MKKNKMMRMASGLLVLTLLTTSIISGTFAKYTTTSKGSDTATVAKWGVVASVSGNLYGAYYGTTTANAPVATGSAITVASSSSSDKVLAPGTKNDTGMTFSLTGKPEVSTNVKVEVTAQDIYLKAGTYAVLKKVTMDEAAFVAAVTGGTIKLYTTSDNSSYTKVTDANKYNEFKDKLYQLFNEVAVGTTAEDDFITKKDNLYIVDQEGDGDIQTTYKKVGESTYTEGTDYYTSNDGGSTTTPVTLGQDYYPVKYKNVSAVTALNVESGNITEIAKKIAAQNLASDKQLEDKEASSKANVSYTVEKAYAITSSAINFDSVFGNNTITWNWAFGEKETTTAADNGDTVLGNLIALGNSSTDASSAAKVVRVGSKDAITVLTVSDGIVKDDNDEVGSLTTSFDITITAEQID